jgi:hypothetical protein
MLKAIRDIAASKAIKHFVTAEDIAKEFPTYKPALPSIPSYMRNLMQQSDSSGVIQKGQPAAQQPSQPIVTKSGTGFEIRKK